MSAPEVVMVPPVHVPKSAVAYLTMTLPEPPAPPLIVPDPVLFAPPPPPAPVFAVAFPPAVSVAPPPPPFVPVPFVAPVPVRDPPPPPPK